jgi:hypothetical protein
MKEQPPEKQLAAFMARYTPEIASRAVAVLAKMRELLPGAIEMVYDNYNALVIGFGPTDRPSQAILSIALYPRWINLFFLNGAKLADPRKLLKGSGKQVRNVVLKSVSDLDEPGVRYLIEQAVENSAEPFDSANPRRLIIKSISAKQRPRRPSK